MPRLKPPPVKPVINPPEEPLPTDAIEIELQEDDIGDIQIDLAQAPSEEKVTPEPKPAPKPAPEPVEDDALQKALAAQQRAEELQRTAQRERDEALRRERDRIAELEQERGGREEAEYNSVLTAIAAEQSALDKAEADYAAAAAAGDWGMATKAQRVLATASARLDRLEDGKRAFETKREAKPTPAPAPRASDPVEQSIAAMQVPDGAKQWLRGHKEYLTDPRKNAELGHAHFKALDEAGGEGHMGTPRYLEALEGQLGLRQAPSPTTPDPPPQPQKRSMPVSAPVSRDVPTPTGQRQSSNKMTLTPEEVAIARASIVDRPDMAPLTNAQKEYIYAQNKRKYQQMKANGSYSEQKQ
jgi:hypothetical protein